MRAKRKELPNKLRTTGITYYARKASLGLTPNFPARYAGCLSLFPSFKLAHDWQENLNAHSRSALGCAPSSWAAVKLYVSPARCKKYHLAFN